MGFATVAVNEKKDGKDNYKYGVINTNGEEIVPVIYNYIDYNDSYISIIAYSDDNVEVYLRNGETLSKNN